MNIDMRSIGRLAVIVVAIPLACGIFIGGMATMAAISGPCECNSIEVKQPVSPLLTIVCQGAGMTDCDTIYTYSKVW